MKILFKSKDGGPDSNVTGYWLIEWKRAFSIVLLRFGPGSRDCYHNHAFNAISWIISGALDEHVLGDPLPNILMPSKLPVITRRDVFHKVFGLAPSTWVLSFRGPWSKTWKEYDHKFTTLSSGRIKVE